MVLHKGFRYRIYPTPEQERRLLAWQDALRFLWNLAHEQRLLGLARPRCERHYFTAFDQINELTGLRADLPWLADVPRNACSQLLTELDKAWQRCFKRLADQPRWKRKGRDWAPLCENHIGIWHLGDDAVVFPKLGSLRAIIHRPLEGTPKTCAITREVDQWFACISCEVEVADPVAPAGPPIGIDRGVVNLLADSEGRVVPNPRRLKRQQRRLARTQRVVARRQKGSLNQKKARVRVARLHRKVRRQRDHLLHVESLRYAKSHGTVVIERLQLRNMTRSARGTPEKPGKHVRAKAGLNRAILDGGWGAFAGFLRYKTAWAGGRIVDVEPAYSSQTCAVCGHVDARSRRGERFECVACGHRDHADVNAAKVILSRGTHGGAVCGGYGEVGRPVRQKLYVARRGTRHLGLGLKAPARRPG